MDNETKELYLEEMWFQLKEWNSRVEELKEEAELSENIDKVEVRKTIGKIQDNINQAKRGLQVIDFAGEGLWQELTNDIDQIAENIDKDIQTISAKFE